MNIYSQYNTNSILNDVILSKKIYSLINHKISNDLKGFELILFENNRLLVHRESSNWAFHVKKNKGYWNRNIFSSTLDLFSINDLDNQSVYVSSWISNFLKEELNEDFIQDTFLEDSNSNRKALISQILNVSKTHCILDSNSKFLSRQYWDSKSIKDTLERIKFFHSMV